MPRSVTVECDAETVVRRLGCRAGVHAHPRSQHDVALGPAVGRGLLAEHGLALRRPQVLHGTLLEAASTPSLPVR